MKLSVVMCTYNGAKYIKEQLDSIINQTTTIDEIIICDDGSTDDTIKIIERYNFQYPNLIQLFQNTINLGSSKNFEKAVLLSGGDYVFFADQDDVWKNDKVEKTICVFKENPNADGVFSNGNLINDDSLQFTDYTLWDIIYFPEQQLSKPIDVFEIIKLKGNIVTGATLCVRSNPLKKLVPFPNSKHILHDGWIALALSYNKKLYYSNENLFSYRIHAQQQIGGSNIKMIKKGNVVINQILNISTPKTFNDFRTLMKTHLNNLKQFKDIEDFCKNKDFFDLQELISFNEQKIFEYRNYLKTKFFFKYTYKIYKKRFRQRKRRFLKKYFNYKSKRS